MVLVWEHSSTKGAQIGYVALQPRYTHSQAATLAQDALKLKLLELCLDTTWKKGCAAFLFAFKNSIMDLENLRDVSNLISTNHP